MIVYSVALPTGCKQNWKPSLLLWWRMVEGCPAPVPSKWCKLSWQHTQVPGLGFQHPILYISKELLPLLFCWAPQYPLYTATISWPSWFHTLLPQTSVHSDLIFSWMSAQLQIEMHNWVNKAALQCLWALYPWAGGKHCNKGEAADTTVKVLLEMTTFHFWCRFQA